MQYIRHHFIILKSLACLSFHRLGTLPAFFGIGPEGAEIEASNEWRSGKAAVQLCGNRQGFEAAGGFVVSGVRLRDARRLKNMIYYISLS
jgi:hypothetical protein